MEQSGGRGEEQMEMTEYEKKRLEELVQSYSNMSDEAHERSMNNLANYFKNMEKEMDLQDIGDKLEQLAKEEKEANK
jgi:hypothetical protein